MGILFTKLWRLFNHQEHKVIIVGLDNAGKTTILYQFSMNEVVHTSPTIGSNVEEIVVNNTHFLMWDIGGQESLRSSWNTYYTNTEFVIVVVDSTDRERISVTKEELYRMLAHERKSSLSPDLFSGDYYCTQDASKMMFFSDVKFKCSHACFCILYLN
ncbi:ADP-ribosylation factor-like protein 5A [Ataeniobius toweri]|uniref:ADP-ribosylation factor-like protein 5A n=1 Tax=Ataeniobius toweri TaxID=208326 RepID=A0ABU7B770_9TELE|nr:ADP-ribosylation factor-like protein 5A [Ataeniobius toweri]